MSPSPRLGIVDYGLGNLASVAGAVERLGCEPLVSGEPQALSRADALILPGVGAFGDGMKNIRQRNLLEPLEELVLGKLKPILCICLGFQLLARKRLGVRRAPWTRLDRRQNRTTSP